MESRPGEPTDRNVATARDALQPSADPVGVAKDLDRHLTLGIAWTGAMKWAGQLATWAATLVLARQLTPGDYGIVGMASLYLMLLTYLTEFGVGTAVVTLRELSDEQIAQLNTVSVIFGVGGFLLSLVMARPIGRFFNSPALPAVVIVMSIPFLISAVQSVPLALLQKDLRFKLLAAIDAGKSILLAIVMVIFALAGWRYWSLVLGYVLSATIGTIMITAVRRCRFSIPNWSSIKAALNFSREILVARVAWYLYTDSDFLVAGKRLGPETLGAYTVAWNLASIPMEKITAMFSTVTPAFFSAVQNDANELKRYFLQLTEGVAMVTFPLCVGLSLTVKNFVWVVLGHKWDSAIGPLRLLALYALLRSVSILISPVLNATRESRFNMRISILYAAVLPACFYFASRWGAVGIAAAWVIVYPLLVTFSFAKLFSVLRLTLLRYLRSLLPAIVGCLGMTAAIVTLRQLEPAVWSPPSRLASEVSTGAFFYLVPIWLFYRQRLLGLAGRIRSLRTAT